ncbi:probable membrane-associated kinase regulator 4 [Rhodamnia argentea]|uniref:Probable membrane-associated kinase regulator 4 n=1 Tax=Rhodamnia argentea TaxID=178133 RepID=A0A8B8QSI0_9MYRT|nr:probable membrane-associated kinase regulator 4 [Rhodamnia argentea]
MARSLPPHDEHLEEEYIDMEVSSYSIFHGHSIIPSPAQTHREFEFQMSSTSLDRKEASTSPADELFYKGKLLPLHLPPRLEMVEKLLELDGDDKYYDEFYSTPLVSTAPTPTAMSTLFDSCNVSPSESFRISRELNLDEYLAGMSAAATSNFEKESAKIKSWTGRIKMIKQSLSKLKASRAYVNALFGKSSCSNESCTEAARNHALKTSESRERSDDSTRKNKFGRVPSAVRSFNEEKAFENGGGSQHMRTSTVSNKRHSSIKISTSSSLSSSSSNSSSSSCSNDANRFGKFQLLSRSSKGYMQVESPIQGAIAYCKQCQNML